MMSTHTLSRRRFNHTLRSLASREFRLSKLTVLPIQKPTALNSQIQRHGWSTKHETSIKVEGIEFCRCLNTFNEKQIWFFFLFILLNILLYRAKRVRTNNQHKSSHHENSLALAATVLMVKITHHPDTRMSSK